MPRRDHPPAVRSGRRRTAGNVLLGVFAALSVAAACVLVLTDDQRLLRLGIVAALWAALVGAFAAARHRRDVAAGLDRTDELRRVYELELEREVAARREHELQVEAAARRNAEERVRDELDGLRTEVGALRRNLEVLLGGEVLVERVALRAESTRLRSLPEQSRAARAAAALPHGSATAAHPTRATAHDTGAQRPGAPQPRQESRPARPEAPAATEVFPRYQASGPRRHDSRQGESRPRPSDSRSPEIRPLPADSRPTEIRPLSADSRRADSRPSDSRPRPSDSRQGESRPRPSDSRPIDVSRRTPRAHDSGPVAAPRPSDSRPIDVSPLSARREEPQRQAPADTGRWSVVPGTGTRPQQPLSPEPAPQQWSGFDAWVAASGSAPSSTTSIPSSVASPTVGGRRRGDLASVDGTSDAYVGRRRRAEEEVGGRSVDDLLASHRDGSAAEPRRRRREGA